jgi:hypothetical protein
VLDGLAQRRRSASRLLDQTFIEDSAATGCHGGSLNRTYARSAGSGSALAVRSPERTKNGTWRQTHWPLLGIGGSGSMR